MYLNSPSSGEFSGSFEKNKSVSKFPLEGEFRYTFKNSLMVVNFHRVQWTVKIEFHANLELLVVKMERVLEIFVLHRHVPITIMTAC